MSKRSSIHLDSSRSSKKSINYKNKSLFKKKEEENKNSPNKINQKKSRLSSTGRYSVIGNKIINNKLIKNLDISYKERRFEEEIENIEFDLEIIKTQESKDDIALINYIKEREKTLNSSKYLKNGFIEFLTYVMEKKQKSETENKILKYYFLSIEKLISLFLPLGINVNDIMTKLSTQIQFEKKNKNNILWKEGDIGEKLYIILKGNVGILPQKDTEGDCTKLEYIKYLIILYLYQENSLISKIISINSEQINIAENNFFTLLSIFKFFKIFTFIRTFKKKYKTLLEFLEGEKKVSEYISKLFDSSPIESMKILDYSESITKELYDFYTHYTNEINNILSFNKMRHKSMVENVLYNSKLTKKIMGLLDQYKKEGQNFKKFNELFDKITSMKEIDISKIYEGGINDYLNRLDFKKSIKKIRKFDNEYHKIKILDKIIENPIKVNYLHYCEVAQLNDGNIFGELALRYFNKQRNATVITKSECFFGTLTKPIYDLCLKAAQDKIRIRNVLFFTNGPIFKGVTVNYFMHKFFYLFEKKTIYRGDYLFHKGDKREKIYFIIKGELELSGRLTLSEITEIIKQLGGQFDDKKTKEFSFEYPLFKKWYEEQKINIKFFSLKNTEISGLDDMTINNIFLFDCICSSPAKTELFELKYNIFEDCLRKEKIVSKNHEEYINLKRDFIVKRIYKQKIELCIQEVKRIKILLGKDKQKKKKKNILKEGYIPIIYPDSASKNNLPLKNIIRKNLDKKEINSERNSKKKYNHIKFKNEFLFNSYKSFFKPNKLINYEQNFDKNNKLSVIKLSKKGSFIQTSSNYEEESAVKSCKKDNKYKAIKLKINTYSNDIKSNSYNNFDNELNINLNKTLPEYKYRSYFKRIYTKPFIPNISSSRTRKNIVPFLNRVEVNKQRLMNPPIFLKETVKKFVEKRNNATESNFYKDNQHIFRYLLNDEDGILKLNNLINNSNKTKSQTKLEDKSLLMSKKELLKKKINHNFFNKFKKPLYHSISNKIKNKNNMTKSEKYIISKLYKNIYNNNKNSGFIDCLFLDNWEEKTQFERKLFKK